MTIESGAVGEVVIWSEALLNGFAFDELTLASRHHLVHDKVECSKWKSLQHLKFIMHAGI